MIRDIDISWADAGFAFGTGATEIRGATTTVNLYRSAPKCWGMEDETEEISVLTNLDTLNRLEHSYDLFMLTKARSAYQQYLVENGDAATVGFKEPKPVPAGQEVAAVVSKGKVVPNTTTKAKPK